MTAKNATAASAARPACVDILIIAVKNHKSAILMYIGNIKIILLLHQLTQKSAADKTQVTCKNHIVVRGKRVCITKEVSNGFTGSGGKCQEKTIIFFKTSKVPILLMFRHFNYGCSYGMVAMIVRL